MNELKIKLVPGKTAPRYPETSKQLEIKKAIITEKGMQSDLPLVDIVLTDKEGEEHFAMITGSLLINLAAAIMGVNIRNHGEPDPGSNNTSIIHPDEMEH